MVLWELVGKPVTDTPNGQNTTGTGGVRLDFLSELSDVNIHHPVDHYGISLWIKSVQKFVSCEDAAWSGHKGCQEGILVWGERYRPVSNAQAAFLQVKVYLSV